MFSQNLLTQLDSIFKENQLMGLSVSYFNNNIEKHFEIGFKNIEKQTLINQNTKYRIASISKSFTTLGLMKLESKGKFKLDEPISKYLGYTVANPKFPQIPITFRMLVTHTSSINDGKGYDNFLEDTYNDTDIPNINSAFLKDGKHYTDDMWMDKKPGTFFTYCNLNYGIIGTLIEKISGQRFDVFMKNEILKPLNINTSYNINDIDDIENIATLYRGKDNVWTPTKDDYSAKPPKIFDLTGFEIGKNGTFFGPQGGLRVSAKNLIVFLKYLKSDGTTVPNLISKKTIQKMKQMQWKFDGTNGDCYDNFYNSWGLGLHITNTNEKDVVFDEKKYGHFTGHAGDAYGLISDAFFSEKKNFGIVIITNGSKNPFAKSKNTSFYNFEEEIFNAVCRELTRKAIK